MTIQPLQLDPEVEGILREVAADPRSKLLRVPRKTPIRALMEQRPMVGVATAGLTVAERQLVQTYRAEVAYALRYAAWHLLCSSETVTNVFSIQAPGHSWLIPTPTPSMVHSTIAAVIEEPCNESQHEARGLLGECESTDVARWPTVVQLSTAAHRLFPLPNSMIHSAGSLINTDPRSAVQLLDSLLEQPLASWERAIVLSNRALGSFALGKRRTAHECYGMAADLRPDLASAVASRFATAAHLCDLKALDAASRTLDDGWPSDSVVISAIISGYARRDGRSRWPLSSESRQCLKTLSTHPGTTTWRLVNALQ